VVSEVPTPASAPVSATVDDFTVTTNENTTAEALAENLASEPAPKDGPALSPEEAEREERSKAAAKLGKAGGAAAAKAREAKADEAPEDDLAEEKKGKKEEEEKPRDEAEVRASRAKARIEALARERAEAREELEATKAELARMRAEAERARPAPAAPRPGESPEGRPRPEQYETYEEYVDAVADWRADQRVQKVIREAQERHLREEAEGRVHERVKSFHERVQKVDDFLNRVDPQILGLTPTFVMSDARRPGPSNVLADELVGSELGPDLMLYLTERPDEYTRILKLPTPREIARAIAKLEERLERARTITPEAGHTMQEGSYRRLEFPSSAAKPPVKPLAAVVSPTSPDPEDFDEYVRVANARDAARRRGR